MLRQRRSPTLTHHIDHVHQPAACIVLHASVAIIRPERIGRTPFSRRYARELNKSSFRIQRRHVVVTVQLSVQNRDISTTTIPSLAQNPTTWVKTIQNLCKPMTEKERVVFYVCFTVTRS